MRIRNASKENPASLGLVDKDNKHAVTRQSQVFGEHLLKIQEKVVHEKLDNLFKDIEKQGKVLSGTLNVKDLKKYKDFIRKFLDYAVNNMYRLKEQSGWDRRGRHKIYSVVETVNKELEALTKMLLEEQKDQIGILTKVDEIRGLLVDMYS